MRNVTWGTLVLALLTLWGATLSAEPLAVSADRDRIRAHLLEVEAELLAADVSHLSEAQRAARGANIETLRAYRIRGEFPHNTYQAGRTPVFIDADGRACAVGHLMIESGWDHAARAISGRENLARLPNMKSPEVTEWLKVSGLTAAEATRIQPSYSDIFCGVECDCTYDGSDATRPVCGSDGRSYLNACVARACGGDISFTPGCCDPRNIATISPDRLNPTADMASPTDIGISACSGFWIEGDLGAFCESDPGPSEVPDLAGSSSEADIGHDELTSPDADRGGMVRHPTSTCATSNFGPERLPLLALVALLLMGSRREA